MQRFPYLTDYVNDKFAAEKTRWDYVFLRPVLVVLYFFLRLAVVPIKFLFHRTAWGFEKKLIDGVIAFGIKHFAAHDALELLIRHVQIEPLLYRYILSGTPERREGTGEHLKGIDGDFSVDSVHDVVAHGLTICHDDLSYEVMERFDKSSFLDNLEFYRSSRPEDIAQFSTKVLEQNRRHSLQLFGCTNVVIFIVVTITLFGDLRTVVRALNSFDSDSLLLWCLKNVCAEDPQALIDLDFYLQSSDNRSHYNSSPFLSDPNQYLYHHIAFDEFAYELLRRNAETQQQVGTEQGRDDKVEMTGLR
ncbi:hypothetical protein BH24DEI2_BH24DEI2_12950 [soil metagenome]